VVAQQALDSLNERFIKRVIAEQRGRGGVRPTRAEVEQIARELVTAGSSSRPRSTTAASDPRDSPVPRRAGVAPVPAGYDRGGPVRRSNIPGLDTVIIYDARYTTS